MIKVLAQKESVYNGIDQVLKAQEVATQEMEKTTYYVCKLADIAITEENTFIVGTPHDILDLDEYGLRTLLRQFKPPMPQSYAWKIDNPQLLWDINHNLNASETEVMCAVVQNGGPPRLVGVLPTNFQPVHDHQIIDALLGDGWNVDKVMTGPHISRICMTSDRHEFSPIAGDSTKLGLEVINSKIAWTQLHTNLYTYRLVCANGAVVRDAMFNFKIKQLGVDVDSILEKFMNRLGDMDWQLGPDIEKALVYMHDNKMKNLDILPIKHHEDREIGIEAITKLLSRTVGKESAEQILQKYTDDTSQYDVYNAITASAKEYQLDKSRRMELLGGTMLNHTVRMLQKAA
jgi:hypothetical protein